MKSKLIKEKLESKSYQADGFKIYYQNKNQIAGDNNINLEETIYLVSGKAKLTLQDKTWAEEAPAKIDFPARTYHKIKALTDITFILFNT